MSNRLVNLTLPAVIREIEYALDEYPENSYQLVYSMPELLEKLIAHILSHVPNHDVVEGGQDLTGNTQVRLLQERLRMEMVVRGSILHILRENADLLGCNLAHA